jgi:hypothetical protein
MRVTISYVGARGDQPAARRHRTTPWSTSTSSIRSTSRWGSAVLNQQVPNPFFGNVAAGPLASQATLSRGQLLRPFRSS